MEYINPVSDIFVRYLFTSTGHEDILMSFTNAVLDNSKFPLIKKVQIENPFNVKTFPVDKESVLDVKATDEDNNVFNIEVQTEGNRIFKHRTLYYWAKLYTSQLHEGQDFSIINPAVCINILDFKLFHEFKKYHSTFMVFERDDPGIQLCEHLVIHFLELPKIRDMEKKKKIEKWLYFFNNEGVDPEEDETLKKLLEEDKDIKKAHDKYVSFTNDKEMRDAYEAHLKWKLDYRTGITLAREDGEKIGEKKGLKKGREEGIEIGIEKGRKETLFCAAQQMISEGIDFKTISIITGMSHEELERIKNNKG